MELQGASVNAKGFVGPAPGGSESFRALEDVEAVVFQCDGDVVRVVDALGGDSSALPSLDDWRAFREASGLNLSDAAMRCLCRAAVE